MTHDQIDQLIPVAAVLIALLLGWPVKIFLWSGLR